MNGSRTSCDQPTTKISSGSSSPIAVERLVGVDVAVSTSVAPRRCGDLVERALARAARVDRPRKRHDPDDFGARVRSRLEAVAADRVEADPDRAHRRAMLPSSSPRRLAARRRSGRAGRGSSCGARARRAARRRRRRARRRRSMPAPGTSSSLIPASPSTPASRSRSALLGDREREPAADQHAGDRAEQEPEEDARSRRSPPPSAPRRRRRAARPRGRCPSRRPCARGAGR